MHAIDVEEGENEAVRKQAHETLREELKEKNLEDINVLRITLDAQIEDLEQHLDSAHSNYTQNNEQRTNDFIFLTRKDQDLSRGIEINIRKIERLSTSINHWKTKISQSNKVPSNGYIDVYIISTISLFCRRIRNGIGYYWKRRPGLPIISRP